MNISFYVLVILMFVFSGCSEHPGAAAYREVESADEDARLNKFSSYSIDTQIDMFLFAQVNKGGRRDTYFRYLADHGDSKVYVIARRIDSEGRASNKRYLISVLDFVDQNCGCVHSDLEIMTLLDSNESKMIETDPQDVASRDSYKMVLDRIRARSNL